jgi:hypothetical protein
VDSLSQIARRPVVTVTAIGRRPAARREPPPR